MQARDATYAAPMKVSVRLHNKETGEIKEQEIFMGDFPLMTESGTFVINGAERVVVSQIVRSPGIYYGKEIDLKTDLPLLTSTVIPYRGAWLEYETDTSEVFWVRIDKNRKLPITCLIRALGLKTDAEILDRFGDDPRIVATLEKDTCKTYEEAMLEIYRKLRPGEPPTLDSAETLIQNLFFDPRRYDLSTVGRYKFNKKLTLWARVKGQKLAMPVADPATGEILFDEGRVLTGEDCRQMDAIGVGEVSVQLENGDVIRVFTNQMCDMRHYVDFDPREKCGIKERVRFSVLQDLLSQYEGEELIEQCRLHADELVPKHIIIDDIFASINYMNALACGLVTKDDIDHLGNRRLRCVGELLQNQFRIGFSRMERVIREPDDHPGPGHRHPPEPHQHPACHRRHQGVLRLQPPEPVHGPDQPPGRADPQAASVRPGPRRSEPGARQHGGPRRALQPLWPYVPDRDPRRPQHRSDLLSGHLCPGE